jgi:hypothetical protein
MFSIVDTNRKIFLYCFQSILWVGRILWVVYFGSYTLGRSYTLPRILCLVYFVKENKDFPTNLFNKKWKK